jgi:hypothetical protein
LQRHFTGEDYQIISAGDTIVHFVYQHNGD